MTAPRISELTVAPGVRLAATEVTKLSGVKLKGFSFLALKNVCVARYGAAPFDAWVAQHQLDTRAITAASWIPTEYYYSLIEALVAQHAGGDAMEAAAIAGECARQEISGFFRFVLGFTTPSMVLSLSSRFWKQYYDQSELVVIESAGTTVRAEIRGWPLMSAESAYVLAGAMLKWMETSRAPGIHFTKLEFTAPGVITLGAAW